MTGTPVWCLQAVATQGSVLVCFYFCFCFGKKVALELAVLEDQGALGLDRPSVCSPDSQMLTSTVNMFVSGSVLAPVAGLGELGRNVPSSGGK